MSTRPTLSSIKLDVIPLLTRQQLRNQHHHPDAAAAVSDTDTDTDTAADSTQPGGGSDVSGRHLPGAAYLAMSHSSSSSSTTRSRVGRVGVYMVPPKRYCARANTVQAYGDINREVANFVPGTCYCTMRQGGLQHLHMNWS